MAAADDASSVALLRGLRSGAVDSTFVHRVDVCSAAPADLVANLEPVPGTNLAGDDGYSSVWYFYCLKRYKNAQGKPSGHRQRAIAGGDACWHSETRPKPVKGLAGATLCNLSYGRKEGSSRSFNRLGWCMTEYDEEGGDGHVLCKVYRSSSSLAKGKLKTSSTSTNPTSSEQASSASKRKATADHPQARPSKISHAQACATTSSYACVDQDFYQHVDHQLQEPLLTDDQITMPVGIDYESLFLAEEEQEQVQQQNTMVTAEVDQFQQNTLVTTAEEQQLQLNTMDGLLGDQSLENIQFTMEELMGGPDHGEYGGCSPNTQFTMDEMFSRCCGPPTAVAPMDAGFFDGLAF
ncbi:hypothetical protein PVAP13_9KG409826 [Panicum virgatum]|uniref:NAC domain-containing protein n=1 Tax=Panicum virgatum TaxID=38727 RepID=A0A8T0N7K3_PANVG|nr:hypothetical protein PVAP13_9KG409826 [Panicum virgatum]